MGLTDLILEAAPNVHLEHADDMLFIHGVDGLRDSINFLRGVRDMLASGSKGKYDITVKWDGAPAVFAGINPENGKFFVGTKSIFNKNPKINYTDKDIDENHGHAAELAEKLKIALKNLPKLGIKNIVQGDMMFSKGDIKSQNIDGEKYITFQPNTIVYATPEGSNLAKMIQMADMGIVFHTSYTGKTMDDLSASFDVNVSKFNNTTKVWYQDAEFKDVSGTATMTEAETKVVTQILSQVGSNFRKVNSRLFNEISSMKSTGTIKGFITAYINSLVRAGSRQRPDVDGLISYTEQWWDKQIDKVKTEKSKQKKEDQKKSTVEFINRNRKQLENAFVIHDDLKAAKRILLRKLESIEPSQTKTFVRDSSGYKVVAPEGFVAVSREKGNAVKLVNRLEFSSNNFNTDLKAWNNV